MTAGPSLADGAGMDVIRLYALPMPPSINRAYKNVRNLRGPGRAKTDEYRAFERQMALWAVQNRELVNAASAFVNKDRPGQALMVDYVFCFPPGKLISRDNRIKRVDVDNRIKIAADALGRILAFDDCLIGGGTYRKVALMHVTEPMACYGLWWADFHRDIGWV